MKSGWRLDHRPRIRWQGWGPKRCSSSFRPRNCPRRRGTHTPLSRRRYRPCREGRRRRSSQCPGRLRSSRNQSACSHRRHRKRHSRWSTRWHRCWRRTRDKRWSDRSRCRGGRRRRCGTTQISAQCHSRQSRCTSPFRRLAPSSRSSRRCTCRFRRTRRSRCTRVRRCRRRRVRRSTKRWESRERRPRRGFQGEVRPRRSRSSRSSSSPNPPRTSSLPSHRNCPRCSSARRCRRMACRRSSRSCRRHSACTRRRHRTTRRRRLPWTRRRQCSDHKLGDRRRRRQSCSPWCSRPRTCRSSTSSIRGRDRRACTAGRLARDRRRLGIGSRYTPPAGTSERRIRCNHCLPCRRTGPLAECRLRTGRSHPWSTKARRHTWCHRGRSHGHSRWGCRCRRCKGRRHRTLGHPDLGRPTRPLLPRRRSPRRSGRHRSLRWHQPGSTYRCRPRFPSSAFHRRNLTRGTGR